jgi:High potential iron-sulfur protein
MTEVRTLTRRSALKRLALGVALAPIAAALRQARAADAASLPLLSVDAPEAKGGSAQGPCQLFPGKAVTAAGWCSSWAPQM